MASSSDERQPFPIQRLSDTHFQCPKAELDISLDFEKQNQRNYYLTYPKICEEVADFGRTRASG